jgi:DNA repair exonuclease SbcCD ATPase subunit
MSQPQPHVQPAIQAGADTILSLIESERTNAAAASQEQLQRLEQLFYTYQRHAENTRAVDQAMLVQEQRERLEIQTRFAQLQQAYSLLTAESAQLAQSQSIEASALASRDDRETLRAEVIRTTMEALEARRVEALATRQVEEIQSALQKVGIAYSSADNALQFSAGWVVVLAELESKGSGPMNPDELQEMLGRLTRRLQGDRQKITALEEKALSFEQERQQMVDEYEMEIASLKLEVSMLHDATRSQSPNVALDSIQPQSKDQPLDVAPDSSTPAIPASNRTAHPTPQTLAAWNQSGGSVPSSLLTVIYLNSRSSRE